MRSALSPAVRPRSGHHQLAVVRDRSRDQRHLEWSGEELSLSEPGARQQRLRGLTVRVPNLGRRGLDPKVDGGLEPEEPGRLAQPRPAKVDRDLPEDGVYREDVGVLERMVPTPWGTFEHETGKPSKTISPGQVTGVYGCHDAVVEGGGGR